MSLTTNPQQDTHLPLCGQLLVCRAADYVGSLLRPAERLKAGAAEADGRLSLDQLRDIEAKAIRHALEMLGEGA